MLNFEIADLPNDEASRTLQVRHGDFLADLMEQASQVLGVDVEVFVRIAIAEKAQQVIGKSCYHVLMPEDAEVFFKAEDKPPTPGALKAAIEYRRRLGSTE